MHYFRVKWRILYPHRGHIEDTFTLSHRVQWAFGALCQPHERWHVYTSHYIISISVTTVVTLSPVVYCVRSITRDTTERSQLCQSDYCRRLTEVCSLAHSLRKHFFFSSRVIDQRPLLLFIPDVTLSRSTVHLHFTLTATAVLTLCALFLYSPLSSNCSFNCLKESDNLITTRICVES